MRVRRGQKTTLAGLLDSLALGCLASRRPVLAHHRHTGRHTRRVPGVPPVPAGARAAQRPAASQAGQGTPHPPARFAEWDSSRPPPDETEVIRRRGPWKGVDDVELATLTWVAWYNAHRLLEPLGYVPPAEFEEAFYDRQRHEAQVAVLT
jgi:transposase InsO family protein